jgi:hypothetical protein
LVTTSRHRDCVGFHSFGTGNFYLLMMILTCENVFFV